MNEAHALRKPVIRQHLILLERLPCHVVVLVPWAGLLVVVPPAADRLLLYPANPGPDAELDRPPLRWRLPDVPAPAVVNPTALRAPKAVPEGPYTLGRLKAGGGGRYLVYEYQHALRVLDVTEGRVVARVPGGNAFAAGMSKLVVAGLFGPDFTMALRRYDLATGKLEASAPVRGSPTAVAMGSASAGPVVLLGLQEVAFYDLATLQRMHPPGEPVKWDLGPQRLAASADGRAFAAERSPVADPPGPVVITLEPDRIRVVNRGGPKWLSSLAVAPDARHVFLGGVVVVGSDLRKAADVVSSPE